MKREGGNNGYTLPEDENYLRNYLVMNKWFIPSPECIHLSEIGSK
jgi:hypothetical protein